MGPLGEDLACDVAAEQRREDIYGVSGASTDAADVVVLFPGALGDGLLALPALRALTRRHPGARTNLVVRAGLGPLMHRAAVATVCRDIEDPTIGRLLGGGAPPSWWPRRARLYSFFGAGDGPTRASLAAAVAHAEFFRVVRGPIEGHAAGEYARVIGTRPSWDELVAAAAIEPPASARADALCEGGAPLLVVHRGAGARAKRWSRDGFSVVADWWHGRGGVVADLLGPVEEEMGERTLPGARPVRGWPLLDVLALLGRATTYLGHDSGPSHLAAAARCRGAVLFGPTDPQTWRPLFPELASVRAPQIEGVHDLGALAPEHVVDTLARGQNC